MSQSLTQIYLHIVFFDQASSSLLDGTTFAIATARLPGRHLQKPGIASRYRWWSRGSRACTQQGIQEHRRSGLLA